MNKIRILKTLLYQAQLLKETEEIRGKKFVSLVKRMSDIFEKYFIAQIDEHLQYIDDHPLQFPETQTIEKWLDDLIRDSRGVLVSAHILGQEWVNEQVKWEVRGAMSVQNKEALAYAQNHSWEMIKGIDAATKKRVWGLFAKGFEEKWSRWEMISAIDTEFRQFGRVRASLIAHMEAANAFENGAKDRFASLAKEYNVIWWKKSQTQGDERVRAEHRQNEIDWWIPNDKDFSWTKTQYAPHGMRCRCVTKRMLFNPDADDILEAQSDLPNVPNATDEQKITIADAIQEARRKTPYINPPRVVEAIHFYENYPEYIWEEFEAVSYKKNGIVHIAIGKDFSKIIPNPKFSIWLSWDVMKNTIIHEMGHVAYKDIIANVAKLKVEYIALMDILWEEYQKNKFVLNPHYTAIQDWILQWKSELFAEYFTIYVLWWTVPDAFREFIEITLPTYASELL